MASASDVTDVYMTLRDSLRNLADDSSYEDGDRDDFSWKSVEVGQRAELFDTNPKYGASSPYYDPALTSGNAAVSAANATSAGNAGSIIRCKQRADGAIQALAHVTGP